MKFLVLLVVVVLVLWLARGARRRMTGGEKPPPLPPKEDMVACNHCGLHLPRGDALQGSGGLFCSEAHRVAFERTPP